MQDVSTERREELLQTLRSHITNFSGAVMSVGFDRAVEQLKAVEAEIVRELNDPACTLQAQRVISKQILIQAVVTEQPLEICRTLLENSWKVGFADVPSEDTAVLIYSRYCAQLGRKEEAIFLLTRLRVQLEAPVLGEVEREKELRNVDRLLRSITE